MPQLASAPIFVNADAAEVTPRARAGLAAGHVEEPGGAVRWRSAANVEPSPRRRLWRKPVRRRGSLGFDDVIRLTTEAVHIERPLQTNERALDAG
jgi:hypothetical protein